MALNGGPVLKVIANVRYATDAPGSAWWPWPPSRPSQPAACRAGPCSTTGLPPPPGWASSSSMGSLAAMHAAASMQLQATTWAWPGPFAALAPA